MRYNFFNKKLLFINKTTIFVVMNFLSYIKGSLILSFFIMIMMLFSCKKGGEIVPQTTSNNSGSYFNDKSTSRTFGGDATDTGGASDGDTADSVSDGGTGIIGGDDNEDDDTIIGGDDNEDDDAGATIGDGNIGDGGSDDGGTGGDAVGNNN